MVPTREHWRIQKWAFEQGMVPAQKKRLLFDGEPAILTFTCGHSDEAEPDICSISWESFFAVFDLLELSVTYDEHSTQFAIVKVGVPSAAYPAN